MVRRLPPTIRRGHGVDSLVEHVRKGNTSLQKVVFVLYQDEAFKAFLGRSPASGRGGLRTP